MIFLVILHIKVLKQSYRKINSLRNILHFILPHFDMKYKISHKLLIFWTLIPNLNTFAYNNEMNQFGIKKTHSCFYKKVCNCILEIANFFEKQLCFLYIN